MHLLSSKAFWIFHMVLCFEATDVSDKHMVLALNLNIFKYFVYSLWWGMHSVLPCRTDALNEKYTCLDAWCHFLAHKPTNYIFFRIICYETFSSNYSACVFKLETNCEMLYWCELKEKKKQEEPKELPRLWIAFSLCCILWAGWKLPLAQLPRGNNAVPMETTEQNLLTFLTLNFHFQEI